MTLNFYVNNQFLSLSSAQENIKIASDSKNYLKARFIFHSRDWRVNQPIYAIFAYNGTTYKKQLGVERDVEYNECYVAPEVIKVGSFSVSLVCEDYITSTIVNIPVLPSGLAEDTKPITPPNDLEKRVVKIIDKYLEENEFVIS